MKKRINIASYSSYSSPYNNSSSGFSRNNYNKESSSDIFAYRNKKIEEINKYIEGSDNYLFPGYIAKIIAEIISSVNKYILYIKSSSTIEIVDIQYNDFKTYLRSLYHHILIEYINHNNIDLKDFEYKIDFECNIIEFYEQLEKLKKQYESEKYSNDRLKQLQDRLNKETEKYKNYIGYSQLKDFISKTIEEVIIAIGKDDYVIEICIENMHTIITQKFYEYFKEILTKYAERYKEYAGYNEFVKIRIPSKIDLYTSYAKERNFAESQLEDFIKKYHDEIENIFDRSFAIIDKLNKIKKKIEDIPDYLGYSSFYNLHEEIKVSEQRFNKGDDITHNLEDIERKLEKILKFNENREILNKAYNVLITNYHNKLVRIDSIDYRETKKVNEIFDEAVNIFSKLENQEIDVDRAVQILTSITFNNYDEDMSLIKSTNRIKSCVYIKKPERMKNTFADQSFFYLKEENGNFIMYRTGASTIKETISLERIKDEFILLEDFLQKAEYIGKEYQKIMFVKELILYRLERIFICRNEGNHIFNINVDINKELNTPSDYSIYGGDYKDINELISAIKKQVEESIINYENEEKRKREQPKEEFKGVKF